MIEVSNLTIVERQVFDISVVRVLLYEDHFVGADGFENAISNSRLSRTGPATDAYDHLVDFHFGLFSNLIGHFPFIIFHFPQCLQITTNPSNQNGKWKMRNDKWKMISRSFRPDY